MATAISNFRGALIDGGARPAHFEVSLMFPGKPANTIGTDFTTPGGLGKFLVNATTLPGSDIISIDVPYRGRVIKIPGERVFNNWEVTVINDAKFTIRKALERWSSDILNHSNADGFTDIKSLTAPMYVTQLDRNGNSLRKYQFNDCFPARISPIQLNFAMAQNVEEYNVEFSVDNWTVVDDASIK